MRLFIGFLLPKEIKDEIYNIQKFIGGQEAKINWVSKKNLHFTLKFLGEIKENDKKEIIETLDKFSFEAFKVKLSDFKYFSYKNKISAFYVDLIPKERIINLQQKIDAELLNILKKDQKFIPHLTLGRVKKIKKEEELKEKIKKIKVEDKEFLIDKFSLISSKLTKDGPIYKILKDFKSTSL